MLIYVYIQIHIHIFTYEMYTIRRNGNLRVATQPFRKISTLTPQIASSTLKNPKLDLPTNMFWKYSREDWWKEAANQ